MKLLKGLQKKQKNINLSFKLDSVVYEHLEYIVNHCSTFTKSEILVHIVEMAFIEINKSNKSKKIGKDNYHRNTHHKLMTVSLRIDTSCKLMLDTICAFYDLNVTDMMNHLIVRSYKEIDK